jgi:predicted AAA+ superfamily ATPase
LIIEEIIKLSRSNLETKNRPVERLFITTKLEKHRCNILLGPRGVGKTTILIQYLLQASVGNALSTDILYISCDHILMEGHSLYETAEKFQMMGGKIIAFDEIHKYQGWSRELKSIYDTFPNLVILASGSSALEIHKGSHDLSRRAIIHKVPCLSFREFLALQSDLPFDSYKLVDLIDQHEKISKEVIDALNRKDKKVLALFKQYLEMGFFPYFLEINDKASYWLTLEQNVVVTLESDLVAVYPQLTGTTIKKLKQLLNFIAKSVPFVPNWSKIKDIIDVSDDRTLKTYFKYLEDAGLIRMVSKYSKMLTKLQASEKVYLNNPNQIYALSAGFANKGNMRETFFISMFDIGYDIGLPANGDFMVDEKYCFEVGGRKKSFEQIKEIKNAYVASDDIELGVGQRIPLWLFGFLY